MHYIVWLSITHWAYIHVYPCNITAENYCVMYAFRIVVVGRCTCRSCRSWPHYCIHCVL